ncbi:MAG: methionine adenosyltransferase [Pseudomonadales bacterium]|nr:methionine adenosyltransferase [Anaerolineales bacterium]MCP5190351.1 methionine adenosyltransferase [Pseudomonadales bacterium]
MRNIRVLTTNEPWINDRPVEIVERKGTGHPDSLCDGIAERISLDYSHWCQRHTGQILHHNFDKVQLVAGAAHITYGGGTLLQPIRIQIAGRGTATTPSGQPIPLAMIAIGAAKAHLRRTMRHLDPDQHCLIDCFAGQGAAQLVQTVTEVTANDTSYGTAHWPLSRLENSVLEVTRFLNEDLRDQCPIGEDVKVMGARVDGEVTLTCAVPLLASLIRNRAQYEEHRLAIQQAIQAHAAALLTRPVHVFVNMADDENQDSPDSVYLTLTGTSGECGDDGAVGRGNRVSGLITPFRPVSLEAAAGKNPVSHVGKLYNVLALQAAKAIVEALPRVRQAQVTLLSQIGRPLDQPQVALAVLHPIGATLATADSSAAAAILNDWLADPGRVQTLITNQAVTLF